MPDPRQQNHSLGENRLITGKYVILYDEVWSVVVLK